MQVATDSFCHRFPTRPSLPKPRKKAEGKDVISYLLASLTTQSRHFVEAAKNALDQGRQSIPGGGNS
jgi:hypothetical protein